MMEIKDQSYQRLFGEDPKVPVNVEILDDGVLFSNNNFQLGVSKEDFLKIGKRLVGSALPFNE